MMTLKRFQLGKPAAAIIGILAATQVAMADPRPRPSDDANPQKILSVFGGNTWIWSQGGAHYGSGGKFRAVWKDAIGIGKWYVTTRGTLCQEAVWRDGPGQAGKMIKRCQKHVTDGSGQLWQQNPDDRSWFVFSEQKETRAGDALPAKFRALRKKYGV